MNRVADHLKLLVLLLATWLFVSDSITDATAIADASSTVTAVTAGILSPGHTPTTSGPTETVTHQLENIDIAGNVAAPAGNRRRLQGDERITDIYPVDPNLRLFVDPPDGAMRPTAMGIFARGLTPTGTTTAVVYYAFENSPLTLLSPAVTYGSPYIQIDTPYGFGRNRYIHLVAVDKGYRSANISLHYIVEAAARPNSFMFVAPSVETNGYLLKIGLEMKANARAQTAGGQEFADFFNRLGAGPYPTQIANMHMPRIDPDLTAFEGGVAVNGTGDKHYGIFFPYHNGHKFFGKVVRIDLGRWQNTTANNQSDNTCFYNWRMESFDLVNKSKIIVTGQTYDKWKNTFTHIPPSREHACVSILDLSTVHPHARGFRRGFVGYPYVYLSPGEFQVAVRLLVEGSSFGIDNVEFLDLGVIDSTLGGYSAGFDDGAWSCFTPFRTYFGPIGGLRSQLPVDVHQLRPYYHGRMLCLHEEAYKTNAQNASAFNATTLQRYVRTLDTSNMLPELRGFSDSIRVGRYVYLVPFSSDSEVYVGKLVRLDLSFGDIGAVIDHIAVTGSPVSSVMRVIDLSIISPAYKGFSSVFQCGQYLFLVPYRNTYTPSNGQRGHGNIVRLDMNDFTVNGIRGINLGIFLRTQVPSFPDEDLRGFVHGFASGQYGVLVPFYNAVYSGKFARFLGHVNPTNFSQSMPPLDLNLQELDTTTDRIHPGLFLGYRGAFPSYWNGVDLNYFVN